MKTDVVQKAVIVNLDKQILLIRRSDTDTRRPLQWDLPGGAYEDGEELIAGVNREIVEETGLQVTNLLPIYTKTEVRTFDDAGENKTKNVVFIFYLGHFATGEVVLSFEHSEFKWAPIEQAIEEYEYPLHIELLKYIRDNQLID